jgi:REP element-mobilizing transposase RayT
MANTYTNLLTHFVFSTKDRAPLMTPALRGRLLPYMGGIVRNLGGVALGLNGVVDHIHLLASLPPTIAPADFVGKLKANSSGWVHQTFPEHWAFRWQTGYSGFTVSNSRKGEVLKYIAGQEEHHRRMSFQEELLTFLKKHEVEYDQRYVFE